MVNGTFSGAGQKQIQNAQNAKFEKFFTEAGRRQQVEPSEENRKREEPVRRSEFAPRYDDAKAGASAVQVQEPEAPVDETRLEEQIVEKVAEVMEIPVEVLTELFVETELTPLDLTETQAVITILQHALEAESPSELLNDPVFPEKYKAVNEVVTEIVAAAKPEVRETKIKLSEDTLALAEELEMEIEDGEIIVKNNEQPSLRNFEQAETKNSQATQSEIQTVETTFESKEIFVEDEPVANETPSANNIEMLAARAEQAVNRAVPQQPVNTANVIEQIMSQVKVSNAGANFTEIRLTLKPESLGDIVLRVLTQNGIVTAQFEAESQRVKEALESSFNLLRDALQEAGIKFSELSVSVRQDNDEKMKQFEKARQASRNRAESIEDISEEAEISYHNGMIDVTA
jgi:flagellar hook-length control protein FliK